MNEKGKKIQSGQIRVEIAQAEDLKPYGRNARVHTPEAVRRLAAIISEMGWTSPILIDGQGVVAGHKRRLAAIEIYAGGGAIRLPGGAQLPAGSVPVIDVSGWSEAQRRAYVIADNQTTLESEWDGETLRLELGWLEASGEIEMGLTGFDGEALAAALAAEPDLTGKGSAAGDGGSETYAETFSIIVTCEGEDHQKVVYEELSAAGYTCKVLVN